MVRYKDHEKEPDDMRDKRIKFINKIPEIGGIYKIKYLPLNVSYIGASLNIRKRCYEHFNNMRISSKHNRMSYFYRKHGVVAFSVRVLEECDENGMLPMLEELYVGNALMRGETIWNIEMPKRHRDWNREVTSEENMDQD